MIEIVYEKDKQKPEGNEEFFRIPNNIRQIGEMEGTQKIYIEDYAYTYLCRSSNENSGRGIAAILMGQANWKDGISYLFIKSAVELHDMEVSEEHVVFTQEVWNYVYEKNKEFFQDQEVVGWFLSLPGCSMELHEVLCKTHLNHFGGNDKVLFLMEPLEKEESFYRYEDGRMSRQAGFYVYYEKNEPMRNFLISENQNMEQKSEVVDDSAVQHFRKKVEKKTEKEEQKQKIPVFKTASACALAAVLAVGVLYMNDYKKLRSAKEVIASLDKKRTKTEEEVTPVNGLITEENTETSTENQVEDIEAGVNLIDQREESSTENTELKSQDTETQNQEAETENKDTEIDVEDESEEDAYNLDGEEIEDETETTAGTSSHKTYTIQAGDTMTKISIRNYGSTSKIKDICELNQMSEEDLIYPGQKILLP